METVKPKSTLNTVLATLGIILMFFVLVTVYFVIDKPLHVTQTLFGSTEEGNIVVRNEAVVLDSLAVGDSFTLTTVQKDAMRGFGVDTATIPATISSLQIACFEEKLGRERVIEIREGSLLSAIEYHKVKNCL